MSIKQFKLEWDGMGWAELQTEWNGMDDDAQFDLWEHTTQHIPNQTHFSLIASTVVLNMLIIAVHCMLLLLYIGTATTAANRSFESNFNQYEI